MEHYDVGDMNLVMIDGIISHKKLTHIPSGNISRLGFLLSWKSPVYREGQRKINSDGTEATKDITFACQAW
jgi:hypothetical protein